MIGGEGGRLAVRPHAGFLAVSAILAAQGVRDDILRLHRPDRPEDLHLLVAHGLGFEPDGSLHRGEREELEQVALEHVAQHAGRVVVACPMANGERFGSGDLDMVDVVAVPDRLEDRVGEPQHQDVLHRLLAQVMVDPVDLALGEDVVDLPIELSGAGQVRAEGFFDHDASRPVVFAGHAGGTQVGHGRFVELRSHGQVVDPRCRATTLDLLQQLAECMEVVDTVDTPGEIEDA